MYDTATKWREGFIRFDTTDHSFILKDTEFFFVDDHTGERISLGHNSGDGRVGEDQARESFEVQKKKVMNDFKT